MKNFWETLPRPFYALAPMEDVTDAAFRHLIAKYGKPDVMFTEFISADGLILGGKQNGGELPRKLQAKLLFSEIERPIVAQLFTSSPERMEKAAALVAGSGFDGVDINMGCPDRTVERSGCGAALMKNPALARELIRAAKRGFCSNVRPTRSHMPVSVKTRIGYDKDELEAWLPELLAENPSAITLHARTRKEMSNVPAHWDAIARAVAIRDAMQNPRGDASRMTLIVGNGDVRDLADARTKAAATGCDGVMLGSAIFGNPFLFVNSNELANSRERKLKVLIEHLYFFDKMLSDTVSYALMKKHFKAYISGWNGAKELRSRLMETTSVSDAQLILQKALHATDMDRVI